MNLDAALDYLFFVEERHRIWQRRQAGLPQPWTDDPILESRKFTNVFRVLDPGTQFLFGGVLEGDPRDVLMRCFLYRHTGNVAAWEHLNQVLGRWPTVKDFDEIREIWNRWRIAGGQVFTGAYLVYPQSAVRGTDKTQSIVSLTERLFAPYSPDEVMADWVSAATQTQRFAVLRRNKGVADFMSMQVLTDWGYSEHSGVDREDDFVVLGPGAKRGAAAIGAPLEWAATSVRDSLACPTIKTPSGALRKPSMMDLQNTYCEFSKYVRFQEKGFAEKPYRPAHPGAQPDPILPQHW